jgi:hypothetical protein
MDFVRLRAGVQFELISAAVVCWTKRRSGLADHQMIPVHHFGTAAESQDDQDIR